MSTPRVTGDGSSIYNGITVNTPYEDASDKGVKVEDFLQLMIAQLQNQDFMNPADDTQYVTQLAQFATMQSMQELSYYSQTNYVTNLVGKSVTVATLGVGGSVNRETGIVTKVNLSGDSYTVTVNGKEYSLSQIMNVADSNSAVEQKDIDEANKLTPIIKQVGPNNISIRWDSPLTDETLSSQLKYSVYYTTDGQLDMSTVSGAKKGTLVAEGLSGTDYDITGLEPGKTHFITVVVKSPNGDEAVYQTAVRNTAAS